jgi:DNA-binding response OmpR family regulator
MMPTSSNFTSEVGTGTELPSGDSTPNAPAARVQTALIVEDDRDHADLASVLVEMHGFKPVVAETGKRGLELAARIQPDVILLDLMLPDLHGFDVCQQLREQPETRTVPIVMVTALSDGPSRRRGFRVGANAYVGKPYGAKELFAAIDTALAWKGNLGRERVRGEIHVELDSEPIFLQDLNEFLTNLFRETPFSAEQIMQLRQAVMEMGQNAIEWGNRHNVDELVEITYRVHDDRIEIVVRDQGAGFDPSQLPHAASPDDPLAHMDVREKLGLREGGFGLLISRGMLDELRHNARGNEVTLIKRFASAVPPSGEADRP